MAPSASAKIEIAAPPTAVWAILMDFDRYPEWNPFIVKISGDRTGSSIDPQIMEHLLTLLYSG